MPLSPSSDELLIPHGKLRDMPMRVAFRLHPWYYATMREYVEFYKTHGPEIERIREEEWGPPPQSNHFLN
jgi:cobalamin biosynthesis Mg chelatase CobN